MFEPFTWGNSHPPAPAHRNLKLWEEKEKNAQLPRFISSHRSGAMAWKKQTQSTRNALGLCSGDKAKPLSEATRNTRCMP